MIPDVNLPWVETSRMSAPGTRFHTFTSAVVGSEVSYLLYLPPSYAASAAQRYPALYWLHGWQGDQRQGSGFIKRLRPAIEAGLAPEMIVVLVNGLPDGMYVDSADGRSPVESMIVRDLVPHIDETCRTDVRRESRWLEGMSMGGCGAACLAFKYPERFGRVSILAGALDDPEGYAVRRPELFARAFGGSMSYLIERNPYTLARRNAEGLRDRTQIRMLVGGRDELRPADERFHALLGELGLAHEFTVVPDAGHHYAQLYDGVGDSIWRFWQG